MADINIQLQSTGTGDNLFPKTKAALVEGLKDYQHPAGSAPSKSTGLYKIATDAQSHVSATVAVTLVDLTNLGAAPNASPAFTGTPTAPTPALADNSTKLATTAYVRSVISDGLSAVTGTLKFMGTIDSASATFPPYTPVVGHTYIVNAPGTYAGHKCEQGDMLIFKGGGTTQNPAGEWSVVQANLDGAVTSAATLAAGALVAGAGGKAVKVAAGAGSATQPVYITAAGVPTATTYTLAASVPAGAKFTDTTYTVATASTPGLVRVGYTASGKNYAVQLDASGNAYVNVPWTDTNTTYAAATQSAAGLMSAADKKKLDGVADGAVKSVNLKLTTSTATMVALNTSAATDSGVVLPVANGEQAGIITSEMADKLYSMAGITYTVL